MNEKLIIHAIDTITDEDYSKNRSSYEYKGINGHNYMKISGLISKQVLSASGYHHDLSVGDVTRWFEDILSEAIDGHPCESERQKFLNMIQTNPTMKQAYDTLSDLYKLQTGKDFTEIVFKDNENIK